MSFGRLTIIAVWVAVVTAVDAQAPARYGGFAIGGGPAVVAAASGLVGTERNAHLELSAARQLGAQWAAALGFDAFVMGTVESVPSCAPDGGGSCEARTERAGTLLGLTLEGRWYPWRGGLGVTGGIGGFYAPSVHGPVASAGAALSAGAEYQFSSASSGVRPVLAVRATRLLTDVGGIRWTVSPTVGLRF